MAKILSQHMDNVALTDRNRENIHWQTLGKDAQLLCSSSLHDQNQLKSGIYVNQS